MWRYTDGAFFQKGTIGATLSAGATSVTFTAGHGARLPSTGDFWLLIYETDEWAGEIVKVTARSTDTGTCVKAQNGTADSTWPSGSNFVAVMSVAALDQFQQDISRAGTYAGLASVSGMKAGNTYYFNDSAYSHACYNGSDWDHYLPGFGLVTVPPSAGWTAFGNSLTQDTTTYGGRLMRLQSGDNNVTGIKRTLNESQPRTITIACLMSIMQMGRVGIGLSDGTKYAEWNAIIRAGDAEDRRRVRYYWNNTTTNNDSDIFAATGDLCGLVIWKIQDNGSARNIYAGTSRHSLQLVDTTAANEQLTATQAGPTLACQNLSSIVGSATCWLLHYKEESGTV